MGARLRATAGLAEYLEAMPAVGSSGLPLVCSAVCGSANASAGT